MSEKAAEPSKDNPAEPQPSKDELKKPAKEQKAKYFKEQFDDEEVLLVFRRHPITMVKGLILFSIAILIGTLPALIKPTYGFFFGGLGIGFVLGLLLWFPFWIRWYFSVYILTNKRFIQQTRSILQVNVVDIALEQIQMINYQIHGLNETLLGFGTIIIQTYVGDLVIRSVNKPAQIQKKMIHVLRDMGIHPSVRPGTGDQASADD